MSIDLLYEAPEDDETIVVQWLSSLRRTGITRRSGDELPFTLVRHVAGSENVDVGTADSIVSVHTLCDRADGEVAARNEAKLTHRRMLELARTLPVFALPDGRNVGVDYVAVSESPLWEPFGDEQILRKVGRYLIGLMYTDQPDPAGS